MKQFFNLAILTTKNPEAFLNFTYESSSYWIYPEASISSGILYVNGLDISNYPKNPSLGYALKLDSSNSVASFHVFTKSNYNFNEELKFVFYETDALNPSVSYEKILIRNRPFIINEGLVNKLDNDNLLVDDQASYLLMRSNPKFTGNIVLYVDPSNNIYMDTFKVSDALSNKAYRKQQVSSNSILSSDVRNVFSSMPLGELYRVNAENTLSIGVPKTDIKDQYITTYNYGAKLLRDELYPEDNGILAPLWINSKLPDYFAVFRLPGVYNEETYDGSALTNLAYKYLSDSDIIRSWSLKLGTPLGKYLTTHMTDVVKIQAPVFLSLTDPDIAVAESDPNTWYGIAVDKGVVTGRSEIPYFFNQKAENFTNLNAFVSAGFERNTLLCPNLINLEFIFSDNDVSLYTMNRYFGFYLTENVLYTLAYYSDTSTSEIEILSLDGRDSSNFINSAIFETSTGNVVNNYKNRIFVINDEVQIKRIHNVSQINGSQRNNYVSKPNKNLFSATAEKRNINPFITLTLNDRLEQGEHLRVINKTKDLIWEIYSVDASNISCDRYCSISQNEGKPTVYRTFFDVNGDIKTQIEEIEAAFDLFSQYEGTPFHSGLRGDNWLSLIIDESIDDEWIFQRIMSTTLSKPDDLTSGFNSASLSSDITFFGRFTPTTDDIDIIALDASYGPIDFELFGGRQSIMVPFFNRGANNLYSLDASKNLVDKFQEPTLYQGTDGWYKKILDIDISTNSYQYVKDPLSIKDAILVMTKYDVQLMKDKFNGYSIYPVNFSIMGINPVKDIDYTVYDGSLGFTSRYLYNRDNDISTYFISIDACTQYDLTIQGSFQVKQGTGLFYASPIITKSYEPLTSFHTFDGSLHFEAASDTILTYAILDGSYAYKGYKSGVNEESIWDYYDSSALLKYGLTVPQVSKWASIGTDCRNNEFRLYLDASSLDGSTNFIPTANEFTQEISYPVFKYLTPGDRGWENYIFYDINDLITDGSENITFKDAMFKYPYVDYFSKLVYSNFNVEGTKTRSTIAYYNGYKNTIDILFLGLKFSINVENIAKNVFDIKNYDRYRFSFISTSSKNKDGKRPIEVIINENARTILMIWYQGNDELNYNMRYSSFLPGKSVLDSSSSGFITGVDASRYSFVKTPFNVNNSTIQKNISNLYGTNSYYNPAMFNPYAQLNLNTNGFNSVWNAFGRNSISQGIFTAEADKQFNTFPQYVSYLYLADANTYGDNVVNYGYQYFSNKNWYTNNTTKLQTLQYLLSSTYRYVMYSVIRGDEVYDSTDFGNSNPFSISINSPRTYRGLYTYNGWFKPKFNTILEFQANDSLELISTVNRDFIFSNTSLRKYNDIPQLWYNKVVSTVQQSDIDTGNAIEFTSGFNVFKSIWDAEYYTKDGVPINGYESPEELPSFFGSKLPKLPDSLLLNNWDLTTAMVTQLTSTEITLSFNLTRSVLNKFKTNTEFLGNWSGLSNADSVIDAYVKNTILSYYNISQPKIQVGFFYKPFENSVLSYTNDNNFISDGKQNWNGQLVYLNDEYIYVIVIPINGNYSYFVDFTLKEK